MRSLLLWSLSFATLAAGCSEDAPPSTPTDAALSPDGDREDRGSLPDDIAAPLDVVAAEDVAPREDTVDVVAPEDVSAPEDRATSDDRPSLDDVFVRDAARDATALDVPGDLGARDAPDVFDRPAVDVTVDAGARDAGRDVPGADVPDGAWRSALFPDDWRPAHAGGRADSMGRILPDFSFAGYHRGDDAPPYGRGMVVRTVNAALGDGRTDATAAIQADLDAACASAVAGLRVVMIPAGTFRLRFPTPSPATDPALRVACSNLVIRGAGADRTRLFLDDPTNARSRAMIRFAARSYNVWTGTPTARLTRDAAQPTRTVEVESVAGFSVGDLVSVRTDITEAFRAEHRMDRTDMGTALWAASTGQGLLYPRRVVAIDTAARTLTLDAPTRYPVRMRDNARVIRPSGYLREVGLEDLSFGMREHATSASGMPGPLGDGADDLYDDPGTAAYEVHGSVGVRMDAVQDGWIYRVRTYAPTGNASGAHVLSSAMFLTAGTSRVTVEACQYQRPQYRGGGGNGYLFWVEASDNLVRDVEADVGRHNLIMAHIACSGNVFLRARTVNSRYADDSHRLLAQANLYDGVTLDRAWLQAVNRGATSSGAGFTATQTVFWNTRVVAVHASTRRAGDGFANGFAIETAQYAWGYAIGTSGPGNAVSTRSITNSYWSTLDPGAPTDYTEGVGRGDTLFPGSLYEEQLRRRLLRGE